ncbi:MAG: hypothetical protein ACOCQP_01415 [Lentisphaeria bacterium]
MKRHTAVKSNDSKTTALFKLLQDDNPRIAALAMEQFLKREQLLDSLIAEYQDTSDKRLRQRLHQLSSILVQRRARRQFVSNVQEQSYSLWHGICRLNQLYDADCSQKKIARMTTEICNESDQFLSSATRLASFMKEADFSVPSRLLMDIDFYLIDSVLEFRIGSSALLCALAQHVGWRLGRWSSSVVLYEGSYCLVDSQNLLIDPSHNWKVEKLDKTDRFHPCSRQDVWIGILSQMFLVALTEGNLPDCHHLGRLMTELNGDQMDCFPYPLGKRRDADEERRTD